MPNGEQGTVVLQRELQWHGLGGARASADRLGGHATVTAEIERIIALTDAGLFYDARAACADLLFCFQPVIVAWPELTQRFGVALRRCQAEQLQRRLALATQGGAA